MSNYTTDLTSGDVRFVRDRPPVIWTVVLDRMLKPRPQESTSLYDQNQIPKSSGVCTVFQDFPRQYFIDYVTVDIAAKSNMFVSRADASTK